MRRTRSSLYLLTAIGLLTLVGAIWTMRSRVHRPSGGAGLESATAAALPELYEVVITGEDFVFHVRYPGPDGVLWTRDDTKSTRDLHVPAGQRTKVHLRSRDFIYNLTLPHLGLKEPAVPDLEFSLEFKQDTPGTFKLLGDQMCGWTHPSLLGQLVVETAAGWQAWCEDTRRH